MRVNKHALKKFTKKPVKVVELVKLRRYDYSEIDLGHQGPLESCLKYRTYAKKKILPMEFSRKVEGGGSAIFCPTGPLYALNRRKAKSCAYMHTLPPAS